MLSAIAIPSFCPSVYLFVTRVDQVKTVQARISKSSPSAAWKILVSGTVKLFQCNVNENFKVLQNPGFLLITPKIKSLVVFAIPNIP